MYEVTIYEYDAARHDCLANYGGDIPLIANGSEIKVDIFHDYDDIYLIDSKRTLVVRIIDVAEAPDKDTLLKTWIYACIKALELGGVEWIPAEGVTL